MNNFKIYLIQIIRGEKIELHILITELQLKTWIMRTQ